MSQIAADLLKRPIPQLKDIGSYRDAASIIKRRAMSVLPALVSLKALRQMARRRPFVTRRGDDDGFHSLSEKSGSLLHLATHLAHHS